MLRCVPSMPLCWRLFFYVNSLEFFSGIFLHLLRWLCDFIVLMWCNTLIDFMDTEWSLYSQNKFHLLMMYDTFKCIIEIWFANVLLRILWTHPSVILGIIWGGRGNVSSFDIKINAGLIECVWKHSLWVADKGPYS